MKLQEAFNRVCKHLILEQKCRAAGPVDGFDGDRCSYRTAEGLKCAVGALIPDNLVTDELLRVNPVAIDLDEPQWEDVWDYLTEDEPDVDRMSHLLSDLQSLHDTPYQKWNDGSNLMEGAGLLKQWRLRLREVAEKFNLESPACIKEKE